LALHCLEILSRLEQSDVSGISSEIFQVQLYCGSFLGTELEESIGYVVLLALLLFRMWARRNDQMLNCCAPLVAERTVIAEELM